MQIGPLAVSGLFFLFRWSLLLVGAYLPPAYVSVSGVDKIPPPRCFKAMLNNPLDPIAPVTHHDSCLHFGWLSFTVSFNENMNVSLKTVG